MPGPAVAIPIALAAAQMANQVWSGYQADKANNSAQKFSKDQWKYETARQAIADRTNAANAATSASQGSTANSASMIDWLRNQYQVGGGS